MRLLFCLLLFCWACKPHVSSKVPSLKSVYIISEEDSLAKIKFAKHAIPPPVVKIYGHFNFVIDPSGLVYFYKIKNWPMECEKDLSIKFPIFLNIKPEGLIILNKDCIADFVHYNIFENPGLRRRLFITISSPNDTIKQPVFFTLKKYLDSLERNYSVRKSTEEEMQVIRFRKSGEYYEPKEINWKETITPFSFKTVTDSLP